MSPFLFGGFMKVQMLVAQCGPAIDRKPKDIVEVSEREGAALIKSGAAKPVKSTKVEKAVINENEASDGAKKRASKRPTIKKPATN